MTSTSPRAAILLTGFEPFGGETINPSWQVAQALAGERVGSAQIVAVQLPTVFGEALKAIDQALAVHQPALVVALGQAGGRTQLSIERVAINVDDARIPDNARQQPVDDPIVPGGPVAYFSTLPIKAMVDALHRAGVPASVSQTAGTFVCNHVFYGLQHRLAGTPVRSGFVHVPFVPEQVRGKSGVACLPLGTLVEGVRILLHTAWHHQGADLRLAAGAED